MPNYHINKDGQQIGPMSEAEVLSGVRSGRFTASDMVWKEGSTDWQMMSTTFPSLHGNSMQNDFLPQTPSAPSVVHVVTSAASKNPESVIKASWVLLLLSCFGSLIPGLGFGVWIIAFPILLVTFILGIIAISRGGTVQGVMILIASLIVVPIFIFIAPIITTGAALENSSLESISE